MDILTWFVSNFSRFKDVLDLEYRVLYFSIMEKTHIKIETNIMVGKSASYICNHTIICHRGPPQMPPAVRLGEGLADDHRDCSLAVHRNCPWWQRGNRKIRAVWTVYIFEWKLKLSQCSLLYNCYHTSTHSYRYTTIYSPKVMV